MCSGSKLFKLVQTIFWRNAKDYPNYQGIGEAVKRLLRERMPLFDSLIRQMDEYPDMKQTLQAILFQGRQIAYNPDAKDIELARMFGYIVDRDGSVQVANRIFEMRLYNFFLSEAELTSVIYGNSSCYI